MCQCISSLCQLLFRRNTFCLVLFHILNTHILYVIESTFADEVKQKKSHLVIYNLK